MELFENGKKLEKKYVYDKTGAIPTVFRGAQGPRAHEHMRKAWEGVMTSSAAQF